VPIRTSRIVRLVAPVLICAAILPAATRADAKPTIKRVFVYVMENTSYDSVVGNPEAPYLNSLINRFALATNYVGTGHASLGNYIAMTSGQPPNPATMADCLVYATSLCIQDVDNIADQLQKTGRTWKGYMDSMPAPCTHTDENTPEQSQVGYSARHNPFVYYRSIVDNRPRCNAHVVAMPELWKDQRLGRVPHYSFLTPDTCHDGHDSAAQCKHGGGVKEADWFAARTVPRILADKSWKDGGLLFLTFDEGGIPDDDLPRPNGQLVDFGGHIFTMLVSPNVKPGAKLTAAYDHYSMLRTIEDVFCLQYLGGAKTAPSMISAVGQKRCQA
jgi:phospholipase C